MHPNDVERVKLIEEGNANRVLTPTPDYGYEPHQREVTGLLDKLSVATGRATCFEKALKEIAAMYPFTSVAGERMARLAYEALGMKWPY